MSRREQFSEVITSRANSLVREARAVREGLMSELIFVEGVRLCEEAVRAGVGVEAVLHTERLSGGGRGARLLAEASRGARRVSAVSEEVFSFLSDTKTPQGVLLLARRPRCDREAFDAAAAAAPEAPLVVLLHRVNNPANAGAILRVAEAAGTTGVVATEGTTDLFSPKSLRGSMGSALRVPVWAGAGLDEALRWCAERGVRTVSTNLRASLAHTEVDWRAPSAIVVGAEAGGLTGAEAAATDSSVRIPMRPPVESLNVAVALAVVLYEAARQRQAS